MANRAMDRFRGYLRRAALGEDGAGRTDGQLLLGFIDQRDEATFAVLVRRHGPLVLGVCRRVLGNVQDAEDAFQVTFLILVKKAATIADGGSLGAWLYKVAFRTAQEARAKIAYRRANEEPASDMAKATIVPEVDGQELRAVLDQELCRLPEKYRVAVVLCELEGRSRTEAARLLRLPEGTLSSRLAKARKLLAKRLTRRGLALPASSLAAVFSAEQVVASCVSPALTGATVQAAVAVAAGPTAAAGVLSPSVTALLHGVLKMMSLTQLKKIAVVVLLAVALLGGSGWMLGGGSLAQPAVGPAEVGPSALAQFVEANQVPAKDDGRARALAILDRAIQAAANCDKLQKVRFKVDNGTGLTASFALQGLDQARITGARGKAPFDGIVSGPQCMLASNAQVATESKEEDWKHVYCNQLLLFKMRLYAFRAAQTLVPLKDASAFQLSPLGEIMIDKRPALGISAKNKEYQSRPDLELFFDKESGLAVKCRFRLKATDRECGNDYRFDDYKEVDGIKTFTKIHFKTDREEGFLRIGTINELVMELREIKAQDKFDASIFVVPMEPKK